MRTRIITLAALALVSWEAAGAITCEQFGAIARQTVQLRDQGASLKRLLADVGKGDMKDKLTPQELVLVRNVVRMSFDGTMSPAEVVEACKEGGAFVPAR